MRVTITDVSKRQKMNVIYSKVVILRSSITHELETKFRQHGAFTWLKENSRFITFFTKVDVGTTEELVKEIKRGYIE